MAGTMTRLALSSPFAATKNGAIDALLHLCQKPCLPVRTSLQLLTSSKRQSSLSSHRVGKSSTSLNSVPILQNAVRSVHSGQSLQSYQSGCNPDRRRVRLECAAEAVAERVTADIEFHAECMVQEEMEVDDELDGLMENVENDATRVMEEALLGLDEEALRGVSAVGVSIVLVKDPYMRDLNKKWRNKDDTTDVLSFPQEWFEGVSEVMLGDLVISLDTAERQAKEHGHSVLDELRILTIHGILHLLDYDHEENEVEAEIMEKEERRILGVMNWDAKGLIESSKEGVHKTIAKRKGGTDIRLLFLDMDGTMLNSESKITPKTAEACRAAVERGVQIVIATGKARPAAIAACSAQNLTGTGGIISEASPGVFLQGLRVYGNEGVVVHSQELSMDVCKEAFEYSLEHQLALVAFSGDKCFTLLDRPLVEKLHTVYYEPRAVVLPSLADVLSGPPVNKLLFYDTKERVEEFLRPFWTRQVAGRASVTQAVPEMLEILPPGASKGSGVRRLLEHLKIPAEQVMAIGDGENDLEMIQIAGLGVAMANGSPLTLAAADERTASNDEDGVAEAIYRFILS